MVVVVFVCAHCVCVCVCPCLCLCVHRVHTVSIWARAGCQIPWSQSYRVLGTEPGYCRRTTNILNCKLQGLHLHILTFAWTRQDNLLKKLYGKHCNILSSFPEEKPEWCISYSYRPKQSFVIFPPTAFVCHLKEFIKARRRGWAVRAWSNLLTLCAKPEMSLLEDWIDVIS